MSSDEIAELVKRRLRAYKENPSDVRDHFLGEKSAQNNYTGRVLLELLQNAEDAMAEQSRKGKVCLKESGKLLLVANEGAPFSLRGIAALGAGQDSPKRGRHLIGCKGTGFKAVLNWTERPEIHSGDYHVVFDRNLAQTLILGAIGDAGIQRLREEDKNWSDEDVSLLRIPIVHQPEGHTLSLLPQDMDTVVCLPIRPELCSVVEEGLKESCEAPERYLFLRWIEEISVLAECTQHTIKIQRLPIRVLNADMLEIQRDDQVPMRMAILRKSIDGLHPSESEEAGLVEVAIALPQKDSPWPQDARVYNFFPTQKASPFRHIPVHATFLLKPDRNDFREDDFEYHQKLIDSLVELFKRHDIQKRLRRFGPDAVFLLETASRPDKYDRTHHTLWEALRTVASNSRFVRTVDGKTYVTPVETRLWKWNLGDLLEGYSIRVNDGFLAEGQWQAGERFEVLRNLGAQELDLVGHIEALENLIPRSGDQAFEALSLVANVLDELKNDWSTKRKAQERVGNLRLWLTDSGKFRPLILEPPITFFFELPDGLTIPSWLQVDQLDADFRIRFCDDRDGKSASLSSRLQETTRRHLSQFSEERFVKEALIPALQNKSPEWWSGHGIEVLSFLKHLAFEAPENDECPWFDELRQELAENVRVPTRNGSWHPAWQTYAGDGWDNPSAKRMLQSLSQSRRFELASPRRFPGGKSCAGLLRYLGVSWGPKLLHFKPPRASLEYVWGLQGLSRSPFDVGVLHWKDYAECLVIPSIQRDDEELKREKNRRTACWALSSAWGFECLEPFLNAMHGDADRFRWLDECRNRIIRPERRLHSVATTIAREGAQGGSLGSVIVKEPFALWQLSHCRVFSVSQAPLFPGDMASLAELFLREPGQASWRKWLPCLDLTSVQDDATRRKLELSALEMGVNSGLDKISPGTWMEWVQRLPEFMKGETSIAIDDIRRFLHDLAKSAQQWSGRLELPSKNALLLPCLTRDHDIEFVSASEVHILDDARMEHLQTVFVGAGLKLLLAEFRAATILATTFGLEEQLLSKVLDVSRKDVTSDEVQTKRLQDLLSKQWGSILALVASPDNEANARRLREQLKPTQVIACRQLEVSLTMSDRNLTIPHRPSFHLETLDAGARLLINASDKSTLWDNVAQAIKHVSQRKDPLEDALARLLEKLEKDPEGARKFLRAKEITEAAIAEWSDPISEGEETPVSVVTVSDPNNEKEKHQPPRIKGESPGESGRRPKPQGSTSSGYVGDDAREAGSRAEDWVRQKLQYALSDEWNISEGPERDEYNRETDIIISREGCPQIHVEVKSLKGPTIFWSSLEVEKAIELDKRYVMAVATPASNEDGFGLYWIYSPADSLWKYVDGGEWDWRLERISRDALGGKWEIPSPPERGAQHFRFRICIDEQFLKECDKGVDTFVKRISRLIE